MQVDRARVHTKVCRGSIELFQHLIAVLGVQKQHSTSACRTKPHILRRIDLLVIPSLWHETFSIVAREALLSGTPIVASEVGAIPEVVRSGQNGLLVPAGDTDSLHHALHSLSTNRDLLARLRDGTLLSAKEITGMKDHVRKVELIYQSMG